jgi:hypothetical protein
LNLPESIANYKATNPLVKKWHGKMWQAEALPPDELQKIVIDRLDELWDEEARQVLDKQERAETGPINRKLHQILQPYNSRMQTLIAEAQKELREQFDIEQDSP